jgi:hypothetical protein
LVTASATNWPLPTIAVMRPQASEGEVQHGIFLQEGRVSRKPQWRHRGFLFLESQLSIAIKRVRAVVAASTLAALTVSACQKDYLNEPRNHETRNGVPAMVGGRNDRLSSPRMGASHGDCDVCGNDYDKAFRITQAGKTLTFDSFECAIHAMAPRCAHCQCHVIGHGIEAAARFIVAPIAQSIPV